MAELRKCSRCTSTIELKYFTINRKGEHYKCCDNCRKKRYDWSQQPEQKEYGKQYYNEHREHKLKISKEWNDKNREYVCEKVKCDKCGSVVSRHTMTKHLRTLKCHQIIELLKLRECVKNNE
jgi:ribosomal protein L20A (L18A)